jgi:hypothetical protein
MKAAREKEQAWVYAGPFYVSAAAYSYNSTVGSSLLVSTIACTRYYMQGHKHAFILVHIAARPRYTPVF